MYFPQAVEREKDFADRVVGIALADSFLDFGSNTRPSVISLFAKVGGSQPFVAASYCCVTCVYNARADESMDHQGKSRAGHRMPDN